MTNIEFEHKTAIERLVALMKMLRNKNFGCPWDLEQSIEVLLAKYEEKKQGEIEQLVRIYGAMKPKDAARIFDSLEMPILLAVVQSMKETKVAPILSAMNSAKATALTEEMSVRRQVSSFDPNL